MLLSSSTSQAAGSPLREGIHPCEVGNPWSITWSCLCIPEGSRARLGVWKDPCPGRDFRDPKEGISGHPNPNPPCDSLPAAPLSFPCCFFSSSSRMNSLRSPPAASAPCSGRGLQPPGSSINRDVIAPSSSAELGRGREGGVAAKFWQSFGHHIPLLPALGRLGAPCTTQELNYFHFQ